jgi:hypothetical protein
MLHVACCKRLRSLLGLVGVCQVRRSQAFRTEGAHILRCMRMRNKQTNCIQFSCGADHSLRQTLCSDNSCEACRSAACCMACCMRHRLVEPRAWQCSAKTEYRCCRFRMQRCRKKVTTSRLRLRKPSTSGTVTRPVVLPVRCMLYVLRCTPHRCAGSLPDYSASPLAAPATASWHWPGMALAWHCPGMALARYGIGEPARLCSCSGCKSRRRCGSLGPG